MRKQLRKALLYIFPITCLIACLTVLWITQNFSLDNSRLTVRKADIFSGEWQVLAGDRQSIMPAVPRVLTVEQGSITLETVLPDVINSEDVLCFPTNSETVRISIDGRENYSYGLQDETAFGSRFGKVWIMVPLDESAAGKRISIELTALSDEIVAGDYKFYLDCWDSVLFTLLLDNAVLYANCLLGLACALLLILAGILHSRNTPNINKARIYLGLFTLMGQMWTLSNTGFLQFLMSNKAAAYLITHSMQMLMPVPFALYLSELFVRWRKHYRSMAAFFCIYYLVRLALYGANLLELSSGMVITHTLILLGCLCTIFLCMLERKSLVNQLLLGGIFVFLGIVFIAIVFFHLSPRLHTAGLDYTLLLSFGIDLLLVFFYSALLKRHAAVTNQSLRLEHQVYTDDMTQVKNRAAFNLEMENLAADAYPRLTLFMVDLNNLKQINDTLGHPAGDQLICALVNCLEESFRGLGKIYRYGGDEFVVVIEDADIEAVNKARKQFNWLIMQHNQHGGCEISVAVGMASRLEASNIHLPADELLHLADEAMYRIKAHQKNSPAAVQSIYHGSLDQVDASTGILTFAAFKTRVHDALAMANVEFPCIVNFDLNNFDGYNNLFGWDAGNLLLQQMSLMAMNLCGRKGFCAHSDADSFWVFADMPDLDTLTCRIAEETRALQSHRGDFLLFPSFGIYRINDYSLPVSNMCSRATSAKKRIKGHFDVLYAVYSQEFHRRRIDNMQLTSYMQKGLDADEFAAFFQPKFSLDGRRLLGAEALVRWAQAPGGLTSPAEFTDLFEKSGLILALDWYMLEKTCIFLRRQLDESHICVPISVNFSRLHVFEENSVERICKMLNQYRLPHSLIEFELTETAFVQSSDRINSLISALRDKGFCVALDDFGSGLSSLGILNRLDVDVIKIDRSLVSGCADDQNASAILKSVLRLCRQLNMKSVVEGVETQMQFDVLQQLDCDMLQGIFLAPSLSEEEFETLLINHQGELAESSAQ